MVFQKLGMLQLTHVLLAFKKGVEGGQTHERVVVFNRNPVGHT